MRIRVTIGQQDIGRSAQFELLHRALTSRLAWPQHRGGTLDDRIRDAMGCGIRTMQKFAMKLRYDISAVPNAIREPRSNGQTEGQINRLKLLKHAMYGRAGVALLRARMRPLHEIKDHQI